MDSLHQFIVNGAPFAFPAMSGATAVGVPTAHASALFKGIVETSDSIVWPYADGRVTGQSLVPLFHRAPELEGRNDALYDLLAITDALRVGTTRVRNIAAELLAARLATLPR